MKHLSAPRCARSLAFAAAGLILATVGCRKHEPPPPPVIAAKPVVSKEPAPAPVQPPAPTIETPAPTPEVATAAPKAQPVTFTAPPPPPIAIQRPAGSGRGASAPPPPPPTPGQKAQPPPVPLIGLKEVTEALKNYHAANNKLPDNLEQLILAGMLPYLPNPPADMKFVIDKVKIEVRMTKK